MTPLRWTTTPPDRVGWWWVQGWPWPDGTMSPNGEEIVELVPYREGQWEVMRSGDDRWYSLADVPADVRWAGPIPAPAE